MKPTKKLMLVCIVAMLLSFTAVQVKPTAAGDFETFLKILEEAVVVADDGHDLLANNNTASCSTTINKTAMPLSSNMAKTKTRG